MSTVPFPFRRRSRDGDGAFARNLGASTREFLGAETAGALALLAAAVAALAWTNVPGWASYERVWNTELSVRLGDAAMALSLRDWVNEGLMAIFFLVVGLEAKRELDMGELRDRGRVALPVLAAFGGMLLPVAVYLAINAGSDSASGWGAAMSTDTAFALGTLALLATGWSGRIRVVLLTIVVVDDLVALVVITTAYSDAVQVLPLLVALGLFGLLVALRFAPAFRGPLAVTLGLGVWFALRVSGVDPLIGGLAIGLAMSAYPPTRENLEQATTVTRLFREQPTPELARSAQRSLAAAISPNERLQHALHPWTSFVIVPTFALANAGIHLTGATLDAATTSTVTIGILAAYVVGKPLGIGVTAFLTRTTLLRGRRMVLTTPGFVGVGAVAGIGFTVALLIAGRAFTGTQLEQAKIGILGSALVAPLVGLLVFRSIARLPSGLRVRQMGAIAQDVPDLLEPVDPTRDHIRGGADAVVTIVEYGDFECEFCGRAEPVIRQLLAQFGDDVGYVFRHLPLTDVHPSAQISAEAAEAAAAQGAFWEMHDRLYLAAGFNTVNDLRAHAEALDLDRDRFWDDIRQHAHVGRIAEDVASADASGVTGTPTIFVNGRRVRGRYDIAALGAEVRAARRRAEIAAANRAAP
ncbi:MAG: Na+/H+ antiporter NhaA [Actinobacteria bacterium]|nr:Na+/H+ antiporter NhaA [Actinomycetota bacterium]